MAQGTVGAVKLSQGPGVCMTWVGVSDPAANCVGSDDPKNFCDSSARKVREKRIGSALKYEWKAKMGSLSLGRGDFCGRAATVLVGDGAAFRTLHAGLTLALSATAASADLGMVASSFEGTAEGLSVNSPPRRGLSPARGPWRLGPDASQEGSRLTTYPRGAPCARCAASRSATSASRSSLCRFISAA